jgi:hypothetical protein
MARRPGQHRCAALQLNRMALTVVEADGFNRLKTRKGPSDAGGRILAA